MKQILTYLALIIFTLSSCDNKTETTDKHMKTTTNDHVTFTNGYADVNGIKMYYEIYGQGKTIILIHGCGSTIHTSFEKIITIIDKNRQIIDDELQAHGITNDRNTDLSFEQDADDVTTLLKILHINKADFFGFSNGG